MVKGDVIVLLSYNWRFSLRVKDLGNEYEVNTFALHKSQKIIKSSQIFIINEFTFFKW